MVRRIAALVLLEPSLDANYTAAQDHVYTWPQPSTNGGV
jgi:hypothetical protein